MGSLSFRFLLFYVFLSFFLSYLSYFYFSTFLFYFSTFWKDNFKFGVFWVTKVKKVKLGWEVPEESVRAFREAVIRKWDQKWAYFGEELGRAMDNYVSNHLSGPPVRAHTHIQLSTRGLNTAKHIMDRIRTKFPKQVLEKDVDMAIRHEAGTSDRTIRDQKNTLLKLGWLKIKVAGEFGKQSIYEVAEAEAK